MLNVTALLGRPSGSDSLRYGRHSTTTSGAARAPVVVWNCTRTCNLACRHCYSDSDAKIYDQLSSDEARALITDAAGMGSPAFLFSGGEPLIRPDLLELIAHARSHGLPVTLSSNGTLIDDDVARKLADLEVRYVGISLDGIGEVHDTFRGRKGAYDHAIRGIRALRKVGVKVGIRITLSPSSVPMLDDLFEVAEQEGIGRVCCYHMVPAGRGQGEGLMPVAEERAALERVFDQAERWVADGRDIEMLTVDNYADGPALLLRLEQNHPELADSVEAALTWNGGQRGAGGRGLAAIDWVGNVRPDQFWGGPPLGSVRERPLSQIWADAPELLASLRGRADNLTGRCATCRFQGMCGGGLTSRTVACGLPMEAPDPGCHLTDREITMTAAELSGTKTPCGKCAGGTAGSCNRPDEAATTAGC